MKRIWCDVETTGLKPSDGARIVEVAAVDETGEVFESLVNPGPEAMALPGVDRALSLNRIEREAIAAAPVEGEVSRRLFGWLALDSTTLIHSFNVGFDSGFLRLPPWYLDSRAWGECVMLRALEVMVRCKAPQLVQFEGGGYKWPKLSESAEFFGVRVEGAPHRALTDARTARAIHLAILERRT